MTLPALSAMVLYLLTGFLALRREPVTAERWLALAAITLQAAVLFPQILQGQGPWRQRGPVPAGLADRGAAVDPVLA
jgi:hypothetical protein